MRDYPVQGLFFLAAIVSFLSISTLKLKKKPFLLKRGVNLVAVSIIMNMWMTVYFLKDKS